MNRGKKLSDGKNISGKNRLTDKLIDTITTYYGNTIRQNNSSPLVICVRPYGQFIVIIGPLMRNLCITSSQLGECHQALRHYHDAYMLDPENQLLHENMRKLKMHLVDGSGTCEREQSNTCKSR
ncbi:transmembrane and TPR repeat-containing protein 1 [Trichonephila clavipes]|nr:transmembrane and TPR repeat-containing protein 1 [Trichonephila clavipes]